MAAAVPDWESLDDSLLIKILSKASATGSFSHCLVNKRWLLLSHEAQSCLKPRWSLGVEGLRRVLEQCPNLTSIISSVWVDFNPCLPAIAEKCTALTHLEVPNVTPPLPDCLSSLQSLSQLSLEQISSSDVEDPNLHPIFHLTNLRNLSLKIKVTEIPQELGNLVELRKLDIHSMVLESLPESLTTLQSLQHLALQTPKIRTLPPSFHRLTNLTQLMALGCPQLGGILSGMETAPLVRKLRLHFMENLQTGLSCLKSSLISLNLFYPRGSLPSDLSQLSSLEVLTLEGCEDMRTFPEALCGLAALRRLDLRFCKVLRDFPAGCSQLTSLESIRILGCDKLKKLPTALYGMAALRTVRLELCDALVELPAGISRLTKLERLGIKGCKALKKLPEDLGDAPSLRHLRFSSLRALHSLPQSIQAKPGSAQAFLEGAKTKLGAGLIIRP